jgi:hypothetical protein
MASSILRVSVLLLTLSPGLYAQAPAAPAPAPAPPGGAPAPTPAPAEQPAAAPAGAPSAEPAPAPTAPATEPAAAPEALPAAAPSPLATPPASASPASSARKPRLAAARRRAAPNVTAAVGEDRSIESSDPSIDLHEPVRAPARSIPGIAAWLGVGSLWLPSEGLDPFAEDDALTTFSAGAGLSLSEAGAIDIAVVGGIDITASDADYRGEATSLGLLRLAVGPELRGSWHDRLYWHGRLAPTLTRLSLELEESSSQATLADSHWLFGAEAAVGLELRFAEAATDLPHALGFFVRADAGYGWTPSATLTLRGEGSAPVRTQPLELGEVALSGPFFRAAVGVGF